MDMRDQEQSRNVEDVRGQGGGFRPIHGVSLGTLAIALIGGYFLGINPMTILGLLSGGGLDGGQGAPMQQNAPANPNTPDPQAADVKFVSQILRSTEQVWSAQFQQLGRTYEEPTLILFRDSYPTGCGTGDAAAGPFYCPNDHKVYLDLSFFDLMTQRLHAPGQFAHAYVIGHEVGHHVQNLLGTIPKVDAARQRASQAQSNALSVRLELQADCYAGVWAKLAQSQNGWRLEQGDVETALNAAQQIGDDTLARNAGQAVVPDSFTHGTSEQRVTWFKRGFDSGNPKNCDTFSANP